MIANQNRYLIKNDGIYIRDAFDVQEGRMRGLRYPYRYVHFYYPIEKIFDEVYRRTSIIGKHRLSADGKSTRLDSIALTEDERDTFDVLCENASIDVYDKIISYASKEHKSYFYNEGKDNTIVWNEPPKPIIEDCQYPIIKADNDKATIKLTMVIEDSIPNEYLLRVPIDYKYDVTNFMGLTEERKGRTEIVINNNNFDDKIITELRLVSVTSVATINVLKEHLAIGLKEAKELVDSAPCVLATTDTPIDIDAFYRDLIDVGAVCEIDTIDKERYKIIFELPFEIDDSPSVLAGILPERLVDGSIEIDTDLIKEKSYYEFVNPETIEKGSFVEYTDNQGNESLYVALESGDTNDNISNEKYLFLKEDWRFSVHYMVAKPEYVKENSMVQADRAIFEALVYHIIANWFEVVNAEEEKLYSAKYADAVVKVKNRLNDVGDFQVISHPF